MNLVEVQGPFCIFLPGQLGGPRWADLLLSHWTGLWTALAIRVGRRPPLSPHARTVRA